MTTSLKLLARYKQLLDDEWNQRIRSNIDREQKNHATYKRDVKSHKIRIIIYEESKPSNSHRNNSDIILGKATSSDKGKQIVDENNRGNLLLFCTMTNTGTIISQIITLLHVSTLSCHPQGACIHYLDKLHKYFKCSCW